MELSASGTYNWRDSSGQVGHDAVLSSKSTIFLMPNEKKGDDDDFSVINSSHFESNRSYSMELYNTDEGVCDIAVVYGEAGETSLDSNKKFCIITDIQHTLNEYDEPPFLAYCLPSVDCPAEHKTFSKYRKYVILIPLFDLLTNRYLSKM